MSENFPKIKIQRMLDKLQTWLWYLLVGQAVAEKTQTQLKLIPVIVTNKKA